MRFELKPGKIIDRIIALLTFGEKGGIVILADWSGYLFELLGLDFYCSLFNGLGKRRKYNSSNWFYGQNYITILVNKDQLREYDPMPIGNVWFYIVYKRVSCT